MYIDFKMKILKVGWIITTLVQFQSGCGEAGGIGPRTTKTCGSGSIDELCECDAGHKKTSTDGGVTFVCSPCEPGTYLQFNSHTSNKCFRCSPGTSAKKLGSLSCDQCSPGSEAPSSGSSSCTLCKPGFFAEGWGTRQCSTCHPGSGTEPDHFGSSNCSECQPGTFSSGRNGRCQKCPPGTYQPLKGSTGCVGCAPGSFQTMEGSISCTRCAPGSMQGQLGRESCDSCPVGYFTSQDGGIVCNRCSIFEYNLEENSTGCQPCLVPNTIFGLKHMDQCLGTLIIMALFPLSYFYFCFRKYQRRRLTTNTPAGHDANSSEETEKSLLTTI